MKIAVLYGTETGNAERLAGDLAAELEGDHDVTCRNLSSAMAHELDRETFYLMVCSTYGDGELPASAKPFAERMESQRPPLEGVHFAIFGLGDSEYHETFNGGSERLAALLCGLGAVQLGERITHDASGSDMAEDLAMPWARAVVQEAETQLNEAA